MLSLQQRAPGVQGSDAGDVLDTSGGAVVHAGQIPSTVSVVRNVRPPASTWNRRPDQDGLGEDGADKGDLRTAVA